MQTKQSEIKKKVKFCAVKNCNGSLKVPSVLLCSKHYKRSTIDRFLYCLHRGMVGRTRGKHTRRPDLYIGKPVVSLEVFRIWSKNNNSFLSLYKQWKTSNYDRKLVPTINRMDSSKGYTLDNMEWLTNSQNCAISSTVIKLKQKKEVYNLLGVNVNV